jgi:flagellar biogenesis protein FliO
MTRIIKSLPFWLAGSFVLPMNAAIAQQLGQGGEEDISLLRVFVVLILCIMLAAIAAFVLRARLGGTKLWSKHMAGRLVIVESRRVTPQASICLIALDGQEYLVAFSPNSASLIDKVGVTADTEVICEN